MEIVQRSWGRSVPGACEEQPGMSMGVVGEKAREVGLYMSHGSLQSSYKLFFNFCYRKFQACAKQNSIMNPLSTYHPGLSNIYSGSLFFFSFLHFLKTLFSLFIGLCQFLVVACGVSCPIACRILVS